jgi:hypothetical protein
MTFVDLERKAGLNYLAETGDLWPLQEWYRRVREIPISELEVGDLAIALRQETWTEFVVPHAIDVLNEDILIGCIDDGELLRALCSLPSTFWEQNHIQTHRLQKILDRNPSETFEDDDTRSCVERMKTLLTSFKGPAASL